MLNTVELPITRHITRIVRVPPDVVITSVPTVPTGIPTIMIGAATTNASTRWREMPRPGISLRRLLAFCTCPKRLFIATSCSCMLLSDHLVQWLKWQDATEARTDFMHRAAGAGAAFGLQSAITSTQHPAGFHCRSRATRLHLDSSGAAEVDHEEARACTWSRPDNKFFGEEGLAHRQASSGTVNALTM